MGTGNPITGPKTQNADGQEGSFRWFREQSPMAWLPFSYGTLTSQDRQMDMEEESSEDGVSCNSSSAMRPAAHTTPLLSMLPRARNWGNG